MKMEFKSVKYTSIYSKLYFWWLIITLFYELALFFNVRGFFTDLIGMFVPIGDIFKLYITLFQLG